MKLNNITKIILLILVIFSIAVVSPIVVYSEETVPLINEIMSLNSTTIQDKLSINFFYDSFQIV